MAKKSRRARRKRRATTAPQRGGVSKAEKAGVVGAPGLVRATGESLAEQYAYVYGDLKRIAILAGGMLAILIALSFVIE